MQRLTLHITLALISLLVANAQSVARCIGEPCHATQSQKPPCHEHESKKQTPSVPCQVSQLSIAKAPEVDSNLSFTNRSALQPIHTQSIVITADFHRELGG